MPEQRETQAPRAIWSGTITFGLVTVPVDLHSGIVSRPPPTRMLAPDGTPLRRRYRCPEHDRPLDSDEIVRGFEQDDGSFVVVEDEELAALEPAKSRDIDLIRFVDRAEIPPSYIDRAYFLIPGGDSNKAYRLLATTMEKSGLAGIATFVMRGREYLVAIVAEGGVLRAQTMRFADEIRSPEDVGLSEKVKVPAAKLKQWKKLVASRSKKSLDGALEEPEADALRRLAEKKLRRGEDVVEAPVTKAEEATDVIDLMKVLKERLSAAGPKKARSDRAPASRRAPKRAALRERSKDELYEQAKSLGIEGRSKMTKQQLVDAIARSA